MIVLYILSIMKFMLLSMLLLSVVYILTLFFNNLFWHFLFYALFIILRHITYIIALLLITLMAICTQILLLLANKHRLTAPFNILFIFWCVEILTYFTWLFFTIFIIFHCFIFNIYFNTQMQLYIIYMFMSLYFKFIMNEEFSYNMYYILINLILIWFTLRYISNHMIIN